MCGCVVCVLFIIIITSCSNKLCIWFFFNIFFVFIFSCTWENVKWSASEGSVIKFFFRLITMFGLILKMCILHVSRYFCVCVCLCTYVVVLFMHLLVLGVRWWLLIGVCMFVCLFFLIVIFLFDLIDIYSSFDVSFLLLLCGCGCCSFYCSCCCFLMFWLVICVKHISVFKGSLACWRYKQLLWYPIQSSTTRSWSSSAIRKCIIGKKG